MSVKSLASTLNLAREHLKAKMFDPLKSVISQGLIEANHQRNLDVGIELMEIAQQADLVVEHKLVSRLMKQIPKGHPYRFALAKQIRLEAYPKPSPGLMSFVFNNYHTRLRNGPIYNKILNEASSGLNKEVTPLNILMEGLAKQGDVKGVESVIEVMQKVNLEPNNQTYGAWMEAYSRGCFSEKVIEIWHTNPYKTPSNCQKQIAILLDSCGFNASLEVLKREWALLKRGVYLLNCNIYASYIQGLIRHRDYSTATSVFIDEYCKQFEVVLTDKAPKLMANLVKDESKLLNFDRRETLLSILGQVS